VDCSGWFDRIDVQLEADGRGWRTRDCSSEAADRQESMRASLRRRQERLELEVQQAARLKEATTTRYLHDSLGDPRHVTL
jgi:hypothetical protein